MHTTGDSLTVLVNVQAEDPIVGYHEDTLRAFLTYAPVDPATSPAPLSCATDDERAVFDEVKHRLALQRCDRTGWRRGMRPCDDGRILATCVSCGAIAHDWDARLQADSAPELRVTMSASGPVLRVLFCDACQVCGGPEVDIRTCH